MYWFEKHHLFFSLNMTTVVLVVKVFVVYIVI